MFDAKSSPLRTEDDDEDLFDYRPSVAMGTTVPEAIVIPDDGGEDDGGRGGRPRLDPPKSKGAKRVKRLEVIDLDDGEEDGNGAVDDVGPAEKRAKASVPSNKSGTKAAASEDDWLDSRTSPAPAARSKPPAANPEMAAALKRAQDVIRLLEQPLAPSPPVPGRRKLEGGRLEGEPAGTGGQGNGPGSPAAEEPAITITVQTRVGTDDYRKKFLLRAKQPLSIVLDAFSGWILKKIGGPATVRLAFENRVLKGTETLLGLEIDDDAVLDALVVRK